MEHAVLLHNLHSVHEPSREMSQGTNELQHNDLAWDQLVQDVMQHPVHMQKQLHVRELHRDEIWSRPHPMTPFPSPQTVSPSPTSLFEFYLLFKQLYVLC